MVNRLHNAEQSGEAINRADLAASFQRTIVDILAEKSVRAAKAQEGKAGERLALAGGVSANRALRAAMQARADRAGIRFYCPEFIYCTDNAAMVGSAAYGKLLRGAVDPLSLNAVPYLSIEEATPGE
ncbi:tRNA N6-adenosine threonylcarbamoyltransferase [bioreactor metagenome]|uniref:tRNA N6-adenosine threonylcarbamoyltransferase n=1 Tax=bioreactor metagenome TaxID=1076179 RepID=A0A645B947_9ZZZZ